MHSVNLNMWKVQ